MKKSNDKLICYCNNVSESEIISAIKQGNTTLEQIRLKTKACVNGDCKNLNPKGKCCSKDILKIIEKYNK